MSNGEVASLEHKGKVSVNCKSMFVTWKSFGTFLSKVHGNLKTILKRDVESALSKNNHLCRGTCLQRVHCRTKYLSCRAVKQVCIKYTAASADEAVSLSGKYTTLKFAWMSLCFIRVT